MELNSLNSSIFVGFFANFAERVSIHRAVIEKTCKAFACIVPVLPSQMDINDFFGQRKPYSLNDNHGRHGQN